MHSRSEIVRINREYGENYFLSRSQQPHIMRFNEGDTTPWERDFETKGDREVWSKPFIETLVPKRF